MAFRQCSAGAVSVILSHERVTEKLEISYLG
jgi:hypothetical protein